MNVGVEIRERALDDDGRRDRKLARPTCLRSTGPRSIELVAVASSDARGAARIAVLAVEDIAKRTAGQRRRRRRDGRSIRKILNYREPAFPLDGNTAEDIAVCKYL